MKKLITMVLALMLCLSMAVPTFAMDNGAFTAYMNSDYYNPDTGNIDDGGTANAALGVGMCRSVTGESVLVEKIGDDYYLTVRLLLQSNTKEVAFYNRVGFDSYVPVSYEIMTENAADDSVDYRIKVTDPFAPIKATMYVTPMGRDVLWYMYADESTLSSNTGDFVVTATADVIASLEQPVAEETVEEATVVAEVIAEAEEMTEVVEEITEDATEEIVEDVEEEIDEITTEEAEEALAEVTEEIEDVEETEEVAVEATEESSALPLAVAVVVVLAAILIVCKKKLGGKK